MYSVALVAADQEDQRNFLRIHRKHLRDASDPFEIPERRFMELYRLSRSSANILLDEINPFLAQGVRNTFIPPPIRMCAALHFFATGSFHRDIGQDFAVSISRSVVCRSVREVAGILESKLMPKWIKFPSTSEYDSIKQRFYEETGFPGVIGAIDCTHVRLKRPEKSVESCYLNRKGYHSKNVQLVCDFNLKILGGFGRFGGASHDAYIWEASRLNGVLQQRYEQDNGDQSWLLGDSGYPLRPWLITPYRCSTNEDEKNFNYIHAKSRNCVERLNGVLKSVFRCLQVGLHTTPQTAGTIINACTVLHNFRLANGLVINNHIQDFDYQIQDENDDDAEHVADNFREATRLRNSLKDRLNRR